MLTPGRPKSTSVWYLWRRHQPQSLNVRERDLMSKVECDTAESRQFNSYSRASCSCRCEEKHRGHHALLSRRLP